MFGEFGMVYNKAQSAMEFLLTYGWAVLIMLAIIAVLFMLGIFSPSGLAPNSCVMPSGFGCYGYRIADGGELWLDLAQSTGKGITITKMACTAKEPVESGDFVSIPDIYIKSGKHQSLSGYVHCTKEDGVSTPAEGEYYRGTIYIDYVDEDTQMSHRLKGEISYRVEGAAAATPTPAATPPACAPYWVVQSCPCTLDVSGSYTINTSGLSSPSGTCITITANGSNSTLNCRGKTITGGGSGYGIYLTSATGVTIKNCVVKNFGDDAIQLYNSSNNIITNNNVTLSGSGIRITHSSNNNTITGNNATNNTGYYGILIEYSSNNNVVTGNNASSNNWDGIRLWDSACNNSIANNIVVSNNHLGIFLFGGSSNNSITGNTASSNGWNGIDIAGSSNIIFDDNIICNNNQSGGKYYDIYCYSSTSSGDSVFNTNYGCNVTQTSTCP